MSIASYGVVLLFSGIAYFILVRTLLVIHEGDSPLAIAVGKDFKGKISVVIYMAAIPLAFINPLFSCLIYVLVAIMWLIPDKRIERILSNKVSE